MKIQETKLIKKLKYLNINYNIYLNIIYKLISYRI